MFLLNTYTISISTSNFNHHINSHLLCAWFCICPHIK
jgi:hypothetical protein